MLTENLRVSNTVAGRSSRGLFPHWVALLAEGRPMSGRRKCPTLALGPAFGLPGLTKLWILR
jgi:hypothetical protein